MDRYIKKYEYKQSIKPAPNPKHLLEIVYNTILSFYYEMRCL